MGAIWKKWASGDKEKIGNWVPLPIPPTVTEVVPTSRTMPIVWHYTIEKPAAEWMKSDFNDKLPGSLASARSQARARQASTPTRYGRARISGSAVNS